MKLNGNCESCGCPIYCDIINKFIECKHCSTKYVIKSKVFDFSECVICNCTRFYRQKSFPALIGIIIVLIGAVLVPVTYGISLMIVALIDFIIYRKVAIMAVCYLCQAEYRNGEIPKKILAFRHHMAEGYEKRRKS